MDVTRTQRSMRDILRDFFYAEEVPYGLALIRICLPLALLVAAVPRWPHARELYSSDGAAAPLWESFGYPGLLPVPSASVAVAMATLYVLSLTTLSIGWMSRTSALLSMVLGAYLGMLDMIGTLTKFTCIATHLMLLLSVSQCGSLWSVDAWLERRRVRWPGEIDGGYRRYPAWPRRLVQLMVAIVYFAAAITKMQTPTYFSGDQLYFWLLTNVNAANPVGEYLSLWPPMLVGMALVTIVWEIVFPFLCWKGRPKAAVLLVGVLFHILTTLMLGLIVFPMVYLSTYWAFFDPQDIRDLARWLRRRARAGARLTAVIRAWSPLNGTPPEWATPSLGIVGWAASAGLLVAVGLQVERRLDIYGQQRPEGPYALQALDAEQARMMLAGDQRVRQEDQLLGFDIGSQTIGGMLANQRSTFQTGERAIIECSVVPPHGDLWVEANLHDERDRMLHRTGQVMTREKIRSHFYYNWTEAFPPGNYDLVLRIDGNEVSRRRVTLTPRPSPPSTPAATAMVR
jgi:hypothetical protein